MILEISLDGGQTWVKAPEGVRVVYREVDVPGEDTYGELHVNLTPEGIIKDVWVNREDILDHNIATAAATVDEIVAQLVENDA